MEITLLEPATKDGAQVQITGDGVSGFASWRGEVSQEPGVAVDVELDVDEINWSEVVVGPQSAAIAQVMGQVLTVRGKVDHVWQDGVFTLRVAGGLLLLDATGKPPVGIVGQEIGLTLSGVGIYPTGV